MRIPASTYRLQFNRNFTFAQAADIVPFLSALGISHCYASPYLRARPGSVHGYDIIDHHHLNPEIGTPEEYEQFVTALHEHGMGQILDIVPNHMGVMGSDNQWWLDVLENGPASPHADFFDIDWEPLKDELQGKVLVAILGEQYGTILDRGELKLVFDQTRGEFSIFYFQHRFPIDPREYSRILSVAEQKLQLQVESSDPNLLELQSLISAFGHLPLQEETALQRRTERIRDKEMNKRRLASLCERSHQVSALLEQAVGDFNGGNGESKSFEALHELIKAQAFRLAHWRVAADDINYRRFFDVNDLAALRQENKTVFDQTHEFVLQLLREGKIDGLRIDHPDGLYDPRQYFERLQIEVSGQNSSAKPHYVIAEKILTGNERLPSDFAISGTTGYDFSNLVNGLFVERESEKQMTEIYEGFIGVAADFKRSVYECKKLVIDRSLNSELSVLASHLSRLALADRHTCDFTLKSLRDALAEIVAYFPVYRTYISGEIVSDADWKHILEAVECARGASGLTDLSVYDFISEVLLTRQARGHPTFYQNSVVHFAMKFQQYTSAVMAKGLEDTSFYRYNRLISLNDVGGDPLRFGVTPDEFHDEIRRRSSEWPHSMVATSTHDSKRSEDVRTRIDVLSEMPELWRERVFRWRELNRNYKANLNPETPTANDEYLLYQTLIGAWPVQNASETLAADFRTRITQYMIKAVREAKEQTSWAVNNTDYEAALVAFVQAVTTNETFRADFVPFQKKISYFGMLNSLAQLVIKLTVPGVPDIYQGNEFWEYSLVDPDNRRAVDHEARAARMKEFQSFRESQCCEISKHARQLVEKMDNGGIKMYVTWKALRLRNERRDLFRDGGYVPLTVSGPRAAHVLAFLRTLGQSSILVVAPRLCARLLNNEPMIPSGAEIWGDTVIRISEAPEQEFCNIFTGEPARFEQSGDGTAVLPLAAVFGTFPVAILSSI
jgi:(1->4)-alpha-D-glucan 1-alpha-D-glucosylmutase